MIDQISLQALIAGKQVFEELLGELWLTMEQFQHERLFDANDCAGLKCVRRGSAKRLSCQGGFTEKASCRKVGDYGFLAVHRYDGELYLAILDVENRIGRVALRKDGFTGQVFSLRSSCREFVQESLKVECGSLPRQSANLLRNNRQLMIRSRRQREGAAQGNPGCSTVHRSETSGHDRYLSVAQSGSKSRNYREPLRC